MSDVKETLIKINGLSIKEDSIYKITNKPDPTAPSGYVKEGTKKLPSMGIGNTEPCPFHTTNKNKGEGVFDTGLYVSSPCYAGKNKDDVRSIVAKLQEIIVKPYEEKFGEGVLSHKNTEFWNSFGVDVYEGRFFVTSKETDLLDLYIAMRAYAITPKEELGNPKFRDSDYCVEDKAKVQNIKAERSNLLMSSIGSFTTMLGSDRSKLLNMLRYLGILGVADDIDDTTLNSMFFEWLNRDLNNPKSFKTVLDLARDKKTKDVVDLFVICSRLATKKVLERESGYYYYNGENLGADLKTVAKNLNDKKSLAEIKVALIELS